MHHETSKKLLLASQRSQSDLAPIEFSPKLPKPPIKFLFQQEKENKKKIKKSVQKETCGKVEAAFVEPLNFEAVMDRSFCPTKTGGDDFSGNFKDRRQSEQP
jgi:hypothetical protein